MKLPSFNFLQVNQSENTKHKMACTIYSSAINLYWNTWIRLSQTDIDFIVDDSIKKWILDIKKWWGLEDNFMNVYSFVKKTHPELKYKIFNKYDNQFPSLLNKGYMIRGWISVNKVYTYDSEDDWIIQNQDYLKMKGTIKHATNFLKWIKPSQDLNKHLIWDSYFWKKAYNLYEVNLRNMKDTIMMQNLYLFYI